MQMHGTAAEISKVVVPNTAVLAYINLANTNHVISIAGGLITIAYALWRWRRDAKKP